MNIASGSSSGIRRVAVKNSRDELNLDAVEKLFLILWK